MGLFLAGVSQSALPQRLERGDVRTTAQILERRIPIVRVSAVCE